MSRNDKIGLAVGCLLVTVSVLGIIWAIVSSITILTPNDVCTANSCPVVYPPNNNGALVIPFLAFFFFGLWLAIKSKRALAKERAIVGDSGRDKEYYSSREHASTEN